MITLTKTTLPGTRFILRDGTISLTPPPVSGDTVLIIGPALDGPINIPLALNTQVLNPEAVFGPIAYNSAYPPPDGDPGKYGGYSGNALIKAVKECVLGGASSILMVRCGGTYATGAALFPASAFNATVSGSILTAVGSGSGLITVSALNPGMAYNGTTVSVQATTSSGCTVIVTQPTVRGIPFTMTFTSGTSIQSLAFSVNQNPRNNSVVLSPAIPTSTAITVANLGASTYSVTSTLGGPTGYGSLNDDYTGYSKAALYNVITNASSGTLAQIADVEADIVHVAGIYADDDVAGIPTQSFLTDLATWCYNQSEEVYPMIGVIGVRPAYSTNAVSVSQRVSNLITIQPASGSYAVGYATTSTQQLCVPYFMQNGILVTDPNQQNGYADVGGYVSCHAGPDMIFPDSVLGSYVDNPAAYYAGLLATLAPQQGATYYPLPGTVNLWYTYSRSQRNTLDQGVNYLLSQNNYSQNIQAGGAYVTFFNRGVTPTQTVMCTTDDNTCSARNDDFANTQTIRIIQQTMDAVKMVCDQFIGSPNNATVIATLNGQVKRALDAIANSGALNGGQGNGYIFSISNGSTPALGQLTVTLNLKPAWEIRFITTVVQVSQ